MGIISSTQSQDQTMPCCAHPKETDNQAEAARCGEGDEVSSQERQPSSKRSKISPTGIIILFVRFYRKFLSPLKPACCRFEPTCSQYSLTALKRHGFFKGIFLTTWRILRCQPFSRGGFDPVPPRSGKKK